MRATHFSQFVIYPHLTATCLSNARLQRRRALADSKLPRTRAPAVRCKPQFGDAAT
jgi:hypothetical protein